MEIITSTDNQTVKRIGRLKQKKYRDRDGEFYIEGLANVLDTARAVPDSVKLVVLSESAAKRCGAEFRSFKSVVFSDELFDKVTDTESASGVLSINSMPPQKMPSARACVLLDRVRDPGNVGTILRTAVAAGYDVILNNCADVFAPKVVRSAMSAIVKCNISFDLPPEQIKKLGYELIACDMGGESVFGAELPAGKYCIAIGNEASGISDEVLKLSDRILSLPQKNIESLNAAVAAGIMMYALAFIRK